MFDKPANATCLEAFLDNLFFLNSDFRDLNLYLKKCLETVVEIIPSVSGRFLFLDSVGNPLKESFILSPPGLFPDQEVLSSILNILARMMEEERTTTKDLVAKRSPTFSVPSKLWANSNTHVLMDFIQVQGRHPGVFFLEKSREFGDFTLEDQFWFGVLGQLIRLSIKLSVLSRPGTLQNFEIVEPETPREFKKIQFKSRAFLEVESLAERYSPVDSTVLITGETGVGKEFFADFIQQHSPRWSKPFVKVNCSAIPEGLLESELFGHEKGAFTDASEKKIGKFELANGGTIFLDEIAEIPGNLQPKLLRVLETKAIQPVGSHETIPCDIRIIAATNQDLNALVSKGTFRQDLYYRLNVLQLKVPPLRQRTEDILILANFFLNKLQTESSKKSLCFSVEAENVLKDYAWPGNVRELEHSVQRSMILAQGPEILPEDLGLPLTIKKKIDEKNRDLKSALHTFKTGYILKVLNECGNNQTKAAQILGIQRTYLSKLLNEPK